MRTKQLNPLSGNEYIKIKRVHRISSVFVFAIVTLTFFLVHNAYAHKVNIFAFAENGMVHAEGYFVDGSKCKNSLIEVFDEKSEKKLIEGYTDEQGQFSFKIPIVTSLKLVLHAGMGHQNEYTVTEDEVRDSMRMLNQKKEKVEAEQTGRSAELKAIKDKNVRGTEPKEKAVAEERISPSEGYNPEDILELEAVIERVTEKKLQPVLRMLASLTERMERPGITEIIGGIGYIFGILGIILYFKSKNMIRDVQSKDKLKK
jgi:nickel transport protein